MAEIPAGTPTSITPYVQVLGVARTVEVLLVLGGSEVYLSPTSNGSSRLANIIGRETTAELAARLGAARQHRIPTAKAWLAERLAEQGLPKAEIARRLHVTDVSVRAWLDRAARRDADDPRQPRLL